jgi:hypothetical protein
MHPHEEWRHVGHHVSHYKVIRDTRSDAYPISIHWRCAELTRIFHYKTHPRYALRVRVTYLIAGWAPYDTNKRRIQGRVSPNTKKSNKRVSLI